jgi:glycosyltransferase involved in cell wall biosynthesis
MSDKLYIIIPAYNEEETITSVVEQWYPVIAQMGANSRLVILNDGSKDNTEGILAGLKNTYPQLAVINKPNSGHGATVLSGYYYALDEGADYIFQTDSDGQTSPDEFWPFWDLRNEYDLVIGQRIGRQDGISRVVVTRVLKAVIKLRFGVEVADANTPFRLMTRQSLEENIKLIPKEFNLSNVILAVLYVKRNYRVRFIPISFKPRQGGLNSINLSRIFSIGKQAVVDFGAINRKISD